MGHGPIGSTSRGEKHEAHTKVQERHDSEAGKLRSHGHSVSGTYLTKKMPGQEREFWTVDVKGNLVLVQHGKASRYPSRCCRFMPLSAPRDAAERPFRREPPIRAFWLCAAALHFLVSILVIELFSLRRRELPAASPPPTTRPSRTGLPRSAGPSTR